MGSDSQKIDDLETWVMSMAGKGAVDNATVGFIDQIRQMVEDMVPQVLNRSAASVQELKRLLEAFTHCRLEKVLQEDLAELQERHFYCRGNESRQAIATAEATQTWSASDLVKQSECAKFVAIDQIPSHDECGVPQHPDTMRYYAEALRNKFRDKYYEWVRRKESCDMAANSTESLRLRKAALEESCFSHFDTHGKCRLPGATAAITSHLQFASGVDELDHRICGGKVAAERRCHGYEECYERARANFMEQNKTVAALEKEMKQEYRALKRIICILKAFEGGVEEKELEVLNLDPVGIEWTPFKTLPPQITCSARKLWPWPNASSAEYAADVYGSAAVTAWMCRKSAAERYGMGKRQAASCLLVSSLYVSAACGPMNPDGGTALVPYPCIPTLPVRRRSLVLLLTGFIVPVASTSTCGDAASPAASGRKLLQLATQLGVDASSSASVISRGAPGCPCIGLDQLSGRIGPRRHTQLASAPTVTSGTSLAGRVQIRPAGRNRGASWIHATVA
eukprot:s2448_g11.t3